METNMKYGFEIIRLEELGQLMKEERVILIDLRDREKYEKYHLNGARNYALNNIDEWSRKIPDGISIVLYCEHGNKSLLAAKRMRGRKGKIYTIFGGIES